MPVARPEAPVITETGPLHLVRRPLRHPESSMSLTITITFPRIALPAETKPLLRTLLPLAGPAVLAVADATGVGLLGRVVLGTAVRAAEDALRA